MFDFHMHSHFSADCTTPMEDMVNGAIQKGMTEICFTEHIDYEYPDPSIIFEVDLTLYENELNRLRELYGQHIKIRKGIEIGVQPHVLQRYDQLMIQNTFDFVICSMHTTDRKSLHYKEIFHGRTVTEAFQLYYDEYLACIKAFKQFNVLGHVDLVKRYADEPSPDLFHDQLRLIFQELIPYGKGIEVNTSGPRYGLDHALPSRDVLELYKQCGGEIITLGSDAHRVREIGDHFHQSLLQLQDIGFRYITTFDQQEPTFHLIDKLL